eukprot:TRINITY_DN63430_c0_g1_i1.p1 TRINITY_DN63430_c0_g1~~TRINITY_DN63430_c0_g1_i1.p1  ORF type:complete len:158 (-),score=20.68 TRINITY_DN63430_c0_g1_i1:479-913(-)
MSERKRALESKDHDEDLGAPTTTKQRLDQSASEDELEAITDQMAQNLRAFSKKQEQLWKGIQKLKKACRKCLSTTPLMSSIMSPHALTAKAGCLLQDGKTFVLQYKTVRWLSSVATAVRLENCSWEMLLMTPSMQAPWTSWFLF